MTIGLLLIIIGVIFAVVSGISMALKNNSNRVEFAFGGFIGPIPFGFFTSPRMFWVWLAILVIGLVLWLVGRRLL